MDVAYREILKAELAKRCEKNPKYSLRAFSRALAVDAPTLSKVLAGRLSLSPRLASKLISRLSLSPREEELFLSSALFSKFGRALRSAPEEPSRSLSQESFEVVSDWYHYAILEMTHLKNFKPEAKWIAFRLGISQAEAQMALDRLEHLELLKKQGKRWAKADGLLSAADPQKTAPALRRRQKQILEKSISALENEPIESRVHSAMTLAISSKKIEEARDRIRKFLRELTRELEKETPDQVYEIQISLFPLTRRISNEN